MDDTFGLVVSLGIWRGNQKQVSKQLREISRDASQGPNKQHAPALTLVAAHRQPPPSGYHHSTTTSNIALTARQRRVKISQGGLL